jgi:uncharacterized protein
MTICRKTYPVSLNAVEGEKGRVEALVSIFGNVDLGGDRIQKGAFVKSIEKWKASGYPVPVVFSHDWGDLWSHIGAVEALEETEKGLKATYTLDVDDNPAAAQVYRLMKRGTLKEHSFAYSIAKEKTAKDGATDLLELDIIEVGPTLKGMNPDTEVLAVKSALEETAALHRKDVVEAAAEEVETKAGAKLSKATKAQIQSAIDTLSQVLSSGTTDDETEKADEAETNVKSEESDEDNGKASDLELLTLQQQIQSLRS